ncbi:MAG: hypothetical protein LLF94_01250 [Chlamydiales bacterium]|nr:hypothetical protein [Chlamydiales bacterium]
MTSENKIAKRQEEEKRLNELADQIIKTSLYMVSLVDKVLSDEELYYFRSSIVNGEWGLPYDDIIHIIVTDGIKISQTDYERIKYIGELMNLNPSRWEKLLEQGAVVKAPC